MKRFLVLSFRISKPGKMRQTLKGKNELEVIEKACINSGSDYAVYYTEEIRGK